MSKDRVLWFDSDTVLLTNNTTICEKIKMNYDKFLVPTSKVVSTKTKRYYTLENKADLDTKTSVNKIGEIVNLSQILNSRLWELKKTNQDYDDIYLDICQLAVMSCVAIDAAKKEFDVNLTKELDLLRQKYKAFVEERPMFFYGLPIEDRFKKSIDNYRKYETTMDYLTTFVNNKLSYKTRKSKKENTIPLSDIFKKPSKRVDNTKVKMVEDMVECYKIDVGRIWSESDLSNADKYEKSKERKEDLINDLSNIKLNDSTLYKIIKNTNNTDKKSIIYLLYITHKNIFDNLILQSKNTLDELSIVDSIEDSAFSVFGLNFKKC